MTYPFIVFIVLSLYRFIEMPIEAVGKRLYEPIDLPFYFYPFILLSFRRNKPLYRPLIIFT